MRKPIECVVQNVPRGRRHAGTRANRNASLIRGLPGDPGHLRGAERRPRLAGLARQPNARSRRCWVRSPTMPFPNCIGQRIRTHHPLERQMCEIRRWVAGAFPDRRSCLVLTAARLRHVAGGRRDRHDALGEMQPGRTGNGERRIDDLRPIKPLTENESQKGFAHDPSTGDPPAGHDSFALRSCTPGATAFARDAVARFRSPDRVSG